LPLSQADAATIIVEQFNPSGFERATDCIRSGPSRGVQAGLQLPDCHDPNPCSFGQVRLTPIEKPASGSALLW
jgi:hypothetical protein